jgi:hypothetical protein
LFYYVKKVVLHVLENDHVFFFGLGPSLLQLPRRYLTPFTIAVVICITFALLKFWLCLNLLIFFITAFLPLLLRERLNICKVLVRV